jgi:DNA repair exonuclease SbcCD ATPase subunit
MTTLVQRGQTLETKLRSLAQAKSLATDLKHIQQRTEEWQARHSRLKSLSTQIEPLTLSSQDTATVTSKTSALRQNAQTVLSRLVEKEDIKELTRDAAWTRLLNVCQGLTEELDAAGRRAWRAHLEQLGTLENPNTLRLRTPPTPSNEDALRAYQASFAAFAAISRLELPRSADDLAQISAHATSCRQAFARIAFDLPEEVKAFYAAINAGTATLAHVTPTVAKWLGEQGHLDRFRVRSTSQ